MDTLLIGRDFNSNFIGGLTISNKEKAIYLWSLKVKKGKLKICSKVSKRKKHCCLIKHLEKEISFNKFKLLYMGMRFESEFIHKFHFNEHPIFELVNIIYKKNLICYKENYCVIRNFLYVILGARCKKKVDLIKWIGAQILEVIGDIKYNIEDKEVKLLLNLLICEAVNSQTLVAINKVGNGTIELHKSIERPTSINGVRQKDKMNFVPDKKISELNQYPGGVKTDEHDVGYHFHYCNRVKGDSYEITRYLLSYNSKEKEHLKKLPILYWEEHSENKVKSKYRLSNKPKFRRAVYHRCNSERRKLFKGLSTADAKKLKFRNKSDEAKDFYDPFISEGRNKKYFVNIV
ncbi:hypothetical protein [Bacillus nitratireducens]|uniref:hypothetical protein n=1 Tax=Bacillus nitratireducens TaxID=2026193 RepID=UPI000BF8B323|nr:hypothetical protein [Bacillus nitratireducens]PFI43012.1 hypothetical protein COI72_03545 [Bacillus cereus]